MSSVNGINLAISSMNGKWLCRGEKDYFDTFCCYFHESSGILTTGRPTLFQRYLTSELCDWAQMRSFLSKGICWKWKLSPNSVWPFPSFRRSGQSIKAFQEENCFICCERKSIREKNCFLMFVARLNFKSHTTLVQFNEVPDNKRRKRNCAIPKGFIEVSEMKVKAYQASVLRSSTQHYEQH